MFINMALRTQIMVQIKRISDEELNKIVELVENEVKRRDKADDNASETMGEQPADSGPMDIGDAE